MRIRATTLHAYALALDGRLRGGWPSLVDRIQGTPLTDARVRLGSCYGQILERPDTYRAGRLFGPGAYEHPEYPEFILPAAAIDPALATIPRDGAVFERLGTRTYPNGHTIATRADHWLEASAQLTEFKTRRAGDVDCGPYVRAIQWRCMVDVFRPARVTYRVFLLGVTVRPRGTRLVRLRGIVPAFDVYHATPRAEAANHARIGALLDRFVRWVRVQGLERYLPDRVEDRPPPPARAAWEVQFEAFRARERAL